MNSIYQEKSELILCSDCNCLVKFSEYQDHINSCSSFNFKTQKIQCQYCSKNCSLELIEEHEISCSKILSEKMMLDEMAECNICNELFSLIQIESHESNCKKLKENAEILDKLISHSDILLPKYWETINPEAKQINSKIFLMPVLKEKEEFLYVKEIFSSNIKKKLVNITSIWRIQNLNLWEKYYREKIKIKEEKGEIEEKLLFFFNEEVKNELIFIKGFDISFSNSKALYGRGIHFNVEPDSLIEVAESMKHINSKSIIIATVLTGKSFYKPLPDHNIRKPPFYDQKKYIFYDSITNMEKGKVLPNTNHMHIVYNNEKAYPLYLIEFD